MRKSKVVKNKKSTVTHGSNNVFEDLGIPGSDELLAKADLAIEITKLIKDNDLTQAKAAVILGVDQPKVSRVMRGELAEFSAERLMHFVTRLGRDVEIRVKKFRGSRPGHIFVGARA